MRKDIDKKKKKHKLISGSTYFESKTYPSKHIPQFLEYLGMWNCFFNFRFYSKIMPTLLMTTRSEINHCGGEESGYRTCHFKEPSIQSHFIIRQMHIFICLAQVISMQVISRLCSPYHSSAIVPGKKTQEKEEWNSSTYEWSLLNRRVITCLVSVLEHSL